jgi:adenosylhomocysteine nucleosidase
MTYQDDWHVSNTAINAENSNVTINGSVSANQVNNFRSGARRSPEPEPRNETVDVGLIAVLDDEMRAVVELLQRHRGYRSDTLPDGSEWHEARVVADSAELHVVALQALEQGQRSAIMAFQRLREHFNPRIVLLVGIAGAVHTSVSIGDVVIGDEVIYYDARRETGEGPRRRGRTHQSTAYIKHRLSAFLVRHGDRVATEPAGSFRIFCGPIGSGEAVITSPTPDIVDWLHRFNEKVLAVETEAGGVGQACYEDIDGDRTLEGWLTVRGITDKANAHDWQGRRYLASRRAALVVELLLPYLAPTKAAA